MGDQCDFGNSPLLFSGFRQNSGKPANLPRVFAAFRATDSTTFPQCVSTSSTAVEMTRQDDGLLITSLADDLAHDRSASFKEDEGTWKGNDDGKVVNNQPQRVMDDRNGIGPQSGYIAKITNDARETEMEENMGQVNTMIGNLRNMAIDMGSELENQNRQIDRINRKVSAPPWLHLRVCDAAPSPGIDLAWHLVMMITRRPASRDFTRHARYHVMRAPPWIRVLLLKTSDQDFDGDTYQSH